MASTDSVSLVNQSSKLRDVTVQIEGFKLEQDIIRDINIVWDGFRINGYITINDLYDVVNTTKISPGTKVIVSFTDPYDVLFLRQFEIIASNEKKEQDNKFLTFNIRDVVSLALERTHMAKSYTETTLTDIIKDMFTLVVDPLISGFPIEKIFEQSTNKRSNFCIPIHTNFLDFIIAEVAKEGWFFYQFRNKIHLNDDGLIPKHEFPYKQIPPHDVYGFTIMSYRCKHMNTEKLMNQPKTEYWCFDKNTKSMIKHTKGFDDYKDKWNMDGTVKDNNFTNGKRIQSWEYLHDNTEYTNLVFKENTIVEIIVPGNIEYNVLWRDTLIELGGGKMSQTTQNNGDAKLSGLYSCYRIEDKILFGSYFIQKMYLKRVNEGNPV